MDLLNGLGQFGLDGFEDAELFEKKNDSIMMPRQAKKEEKPKKLQLTEEKDYLFDKSYDCPVCSERFTCKTVRTGKVHPIRVEYDLRQVTDSVDQVKYEVVACPHCGYAVCDRYHGHISDRQTKMIREAIGARYKQVEWGPDIYTYEQARLRYQLALANAMARGAKSSEKAYICLKTAWLIRGQRGSIMGTKEATAERVAQLEADEKKLHGQALDGFVHARQTENYPLAGMDDKTIEYLLAALYLSQEKYEDSGRIIGRILFNPNISRNLRNRTQDLKEMLEERAKQGE